MGSRPTPNYGWVAGYTLLDDTNPANGTGEITTFYIYAWTTMGGTKVGSFYGSSTSWTNRDYETIGTVNTGSEQSFSGLHCSVETGDVSGIYYSSGNNYGASGVTSNYGYKAGDQMGAGTQTYTMNVNYVIYAYGEGTTLGNTIAPSAIASAEAFGTQKLNLKLAPSGIASAQAFGTSRIILYLFPSSIASAEVFGTSKINFTLLLSGIASAEAFGSASIFGRIARIIQRVWPFRRLKLSAEPYRIIKVFSTPYRRLVLECHNEEGERMDRYFIGSTPYLYVECFNSAGALVDATTSMKCRIEDKNGKVLQDWVDMVNITTGKYYYAGWAITSSHVSGKYRWRAKSTDGSIISVPSEGYFEVMDR
jgi:hypothetical protein